MLKQLGNKKTENECVTVLNSSQIWRRQILNKNPTLPEGVKKYNSTEQYYFTHKYAVKATGYNENLLSSTESTASQCLFATLQPSRRMWLCLSYHTLHIHTLHIHLAQYCSRFKKFLIDWSTWNLTHPWPLHVFCLVLYSLFVLSCFNVSKLWHSRCKDNILFPMLKYNLATHIVSSELENNCIRWWMQILAPSYRHGKQSKA